MADNGDKTEKPTQRRRNRAKEEGKFAYSQELTSGVILVVVLTTMVLMAALLFAMDQLWLHLLSWKRIGVIYQDDTPAKTTKGDKIPGILQYFRFAEHSSRTVGSTAKRRNPCCHVHEFPVALPGDGQEARRCR